MNCEENASDILAMSEPGTDSGEASIPHHVVPRASELLLWSSPVVVLVVGLAFLIGDGQGPNHGSNAGAWRSGLQAASILLGALLPTIQNSVRPSRAGFKSYCRFLALLLVAWLVVGLAVQFILKPAFSEPRSGSSKEVIVPGVWTLERPQGDKTSTPSGFTARQFAILFASLAAASASKTTTGIARLARMLLACSLVLLTGYIALYSVNSGLHSVKDVLVSLPSAHVVAGVALYLGSLKYNLDRSSARTALFVALALTFAPIAFLSSTEPKLAALLCFGLFALLGVGELLGDSYTANHSNRSHGL